MTTETRKRLEEELLKMSLTDEQKRQFFLLAEDLDLDFPEPSWNEISAMFDN